MDKRKGRDFESDESEEEEEQPIQLSQKGDMEEEVNLDFVFLDPKPEQLQSVKNLLNGMLDGISFKSAQMADLVINQPHIGTMVGVEDEKDIFGFVTIINLQQHKTEQVIGEIKSFLQVKSQLYLQNQELEKFQQILHSKVGLMVNERIVNLAPPLVPILHNQLAEDIKWTLQDDPNDVVLDFKYLLVVSKCFKEQQFQKQKKIQNDLSEFIYQKFEDFAFLQHAIVYFRFPTESQKSAKEIGDHQKTEMLPEQCYRLVYLIEFNDYLNQVPTLDQYLQK